VIHEVVRRLFDVEDDSWPSYISWTNLYKVSPGVLGGNPADALAEVQFSHCAKILEAEIMALTPRRILFLTGFLGWAQPFLTKLGFVQDLSVEPPMEASGHILSGSRVAVLPHPQGKPGYPIVTAAVDYLNKA
jgi:hypothetical protein